MKRLMLIMSLGHQRPVPVLLVQDRLLLAVDFELGVLLLGGPVAEVVITSSALSSGERSGLDSYFQTKYGL